MKMKSKLIGSILVLVLVIASFTGCSQEAENGAEASTPKKIYYTFAANPASSAFYPYWVAVGKAVQDTYPEFQVTVSESQGAIDIANRIRSGESILGNCTTSVDYENYNGLGKFEGNPNIEARTLWYYAAAPMYIAVSEDCGAESIADLEGLKYNLGGTGTSGASLTNEIFQLLGIEVDSFESSQADAANAFSSRQIEGTVKFGTLKGDSYVMQLSAARSVKLLSFTEEEVELVLEAFPYLSKVIIPANTYDGQEADLLTVAFNQGAASTTKLTQEEGYKIVKAVDVEGRAVIDAGFPIGKDTDILELALNSPIPLHAGTVQLMVERGIEVPQDLIPEEYEAK
jgi:hypothetical protein